MRNRLTLIKGFILILCIVLMLCVVRIAVKMDNTNIIEQNMTNEREACSIELEELDNVYLVHVAVREWMQGKYSAKALFNELREKGRLDLPQPVLISYQLKDIPVRESVSSQKLEVSKNEDFRDAITMTIAPESRKAEVYNLEVGKEYYYRLTVTLTDGQIISAQSSFRTACTPRYMLVDGIRNCRDIGGYMLAEGRQIRQGMIYRGTELDGAISNKYVISDEGVDTLINDLGIQLQLDLRAGNTPNAKDSLGLEVKHNYYSFLSYSESFTDHGKKKIKEIFADLANSENYPIYIHCTYGADRTGTIIYLMGAILGLSEEDLYREWEMSAFFVGGAFEEEMALFVEELKTYPGVSMQEKVESFLLSTGVTAEEIDSFRSIMLE